MRKVDWAEAESLFPGCSAEWDTDWVFNTDDAKQADLFITEDLEVSLRLRAGDSYYFWHQEFETWVAEEVHLAGEPSAEPIDMNIPDAIWGGSKHKVLVDAGVVANCLCDECKKRYTPIPPPLPMLTDEERQSMIQILNAMNGDDNK